MRKEIEMEDLGREWYKNWKRADGLLGVWDRNRKKMGVGEEAALLKEWLECSKRAEELEGGLRTLGEWKWGWCKMLKTMQDGDKEDEEEEEEWEESLESVGG